MDFYEAVKKAAQSYWEDNKDLMGESALDKIKPRKYNKEYFDKFSREQGFTKDEPLPDEEPTPKKGVVNG